MVATLAAPAGAVPEKPVLVSTFPQNGHTVRSADVVPITATYDRDLNPLSSHMDVDSSGVAGCTAAVPGDFELVGPMSETGGRRTIGFFPDVALTEACSPYTANVAARAVAGTDPTFTHFSFTIDDTPPPAPTITDPTAGEVRSDQPMVIGGSSLAGTIVAIVEGDDVIAFDEANATNLYAVTLPWGLEDGVTHTVEAFALDEAANKSATSGSVTFIHDSAPPRPPVIVTPTEGAFLNSTSVLVSGTAKPSVVVKVFESGATLATTSSDTAGNWGATIVFAPGTHTITATSFDGISPDGPSPGRSFTVDTSAPPAPVILTPSEGQQLAAHEVVVSGTAEPHSTVRVREGALLRASTPADGAGGWSATISFTEGAHVITAEAVDAAGNVGAASGARTFTVDTAAPPAAVITAPAEDAFVGATPVTVSGAAEAGSTVRVREGTVVIGTATASGTGSWSVGIAFADGAHTITATATDAAGNTGPASAPRSFTLDTVAPAVPAITAPAEGAVLGSNTVTASGTGEPGSAIALEEGAATLATTGVSGGGLWSVTITLPNGAHTLTATASDLASNTSAPSPPRSFTVSGPSDVTAPPPPVITLPAEGTLKPMQVQFEGTAEAGATVRVLEGSTEVGSATAGTGGIWRFAATMISGPHAVVATATDAAGNTSAPSPARSFTVDGARPSVAWTTPGNNTIFLPGSPILLAGTASDNLGVDHVELELSTLLGQPISMLTAGCTGCPSTPVTWSASPALAPGVYVLEAFAVDLVGNRSAGAAITIVVT